MMKSMIILMAGLFVLNLQAADYSETRSLRLDAGNLSVLVIDCGAGTLDVEGQAGLEEIRVQAEIVVNNTDGDKARKMVEDYLELTLQKEDDQAVLQSHRKDKGFSVSRLFDRNASLQVNLTVSVPPELKLEIDDGSGDAEISRILNDITIDDGSGDLEIRNIQGDVNIDDGSGQIVLKDIKGNVAVDDGSGSLVINRVEGNVRIDDGSGDIVIDEVMGDVIIDDAGSGGVSTDRISGRLIRH
ncbi:MAG: DUF4097 family beta strand repeat-containing protein [Calditrichia bacterium]